MNKVFLIGRFCKDPELKKTTSGKSFCSFALAVDKGGGDKSADFIDVVAWEKTAEFICKWFGKGAPIVIEGTLATRMYEDRGSNKRKAVEVIARNVEFVPKTAGAAEHGQNASFDRNAASVIGTDENASVSLAEAENGFTEVYIDDEDLPF